MAASQTNLRSQSLNAYSLPLHTAREAMGPGKGMLHQQPEEENKLRIDPDEVGDHMPNINSQGSNKNKSNTNLKTTEAKLEDHGGENNYYARRSQFMYCCVGNYTDTKTSYPEKDHHACAGAGGSTLYCRKRYPKMKGSEPEGKESWRLHEKFKAAAHH
jgi:hypothetical protein